MQTHPRRMRFLLVGSTLVLGACGLVYEYVLSVLGNHLIGSSHEEIFIVIGIMMFAMGLGAGIQRYIRGALFEKFLLIEILLGLTGGFSAVVIYMAFLHTESHRVILYAFSMFIGALIGMEIPLIIRINQEHDLNLRDNLSDILSMDYVGALAGAVCFTYLLLTNFSLARIGFLLGLVNVAVALVGYFMFPSLVPRKIPMGLSAIVTLVALGYGLAKSEDWTRYAEQRYYRDPIVESLTTKYQHLVLTKRADRVHLYINGHPQFSSKDEHIYHEMLIHPAMEILRSREKILILGGGDGLALREILKYPDVESVVLVDIDYEVVRLATEHPDLVRLNRAAFHDSRVHIIESRAITAGGPMKVMQASERPSEMFSDRLHELAQVQVMIIDADRFVRETEGLFNAIFIDLPDPSALELAKLFSVDFYAALRERLAPRGIMAVQSTSPFDAKAVFLCIGKTLGASGFHCIPYHENVPSFGDWGWYLAWKSMAPADAMKERLDSIDELKVPTKYLTPPILKAAFEFGKGWLAPDKAVEENTLLNPVILDYYRDAWKGG